MPVVRYRSSPFDSTCNRSWQLTESPRASRIRPASRIEERSLIDAAVARALVVRDADGHGARAFATRAIVGDEAHVVHAAVTAPEALCAHARGRGAHAFRNTHDAPFAARLSIREARTALAQIETSVGTHVCQVTAEATAREQRLRGRLGEIVAREVEARHRA